MFKVLGITFIAAQAVDSFLTLWATNNGYTEVNEILAPIAHTWLSPVVKILPAVVAVWVIGKLVKRYPKARVPANIGLVACIAFYAMVTVSNLGELR